jgi:thioredoxin 1
MTLAVNQLTFKSEVLESSRPVLVSFWAPWCGICRLTQPMLSDLQLEWGDQIKLVQINADENLTLSSTYRSGVKFAVGLISSEDARIFGRLLPRFRQS